MNVPIIRNSLRPMSLMIIFSVALVVFNINYYLMANFPGFKDNMCVMGAGLTSLNIVFSVVLSLLMGVFVVAMIELYKMRKTKLAASSVSGIGFIAGILTVFCTLCALPVISLFGLSVSLSLFVEYNEVMKVVSVILMLVGLYLLNRQLKQKCLVCVD